MNEWMCEHQSSIWWRLRATSVRDRRLIYADADADAVTISSNTRSYKLDTRWRHRATSVREHRGLGGRPVTHLPMWALIVIIIMTTMIMMMFTMIVMEMKKRSGRYSSTHNGENLMNPIITFPDKIVTCVHLCENGRGGVFLWSWKVGLTSSFDASLVAVTLSLVQWPPLPPHPIPTMSLLQLPMWHSLCIYHCSWITGSQQHSINCAAGCALCIFWPTYCQMHSEEAGKKLHTWAGPTHSGCSNWPELKANKQWW